MTKLSERKKTPKIIFLLSYIYKEKIAEKSGCDES